VALARALVKRPRLILLDGVVGSASPADVALRAAIREALPKVALVYAAAVPEAAEGADAVVHIDAGGSLRYDQVKKGR